MVPAGGETDDTATVGLLSSSYDTYFNLVGEKPPKETVVKLLSPGSQAYVSAINLFQRLDGSSLVNANAIKSVSAVLNPRFASNFTNQVLTLQERHRNDPQLFAKADWMSTDDRIDLRRWVVHEFGSLSQQYSWNKFGESCPVVPMIHGTSATVARKIIQNGFATLSSLDAGF